MTYTQVIDTLTPGAVISFKEYALDRRERRKLKLDIENAVVHAVIPANESLSRSQLEEYYGADLSDLDYTQLSMVNCFRIVLLLKVDEDGNSIYKPLLINQDFYNSGLQEIEIIAGVTSEPIYAPQITHLFRKDDFR